MATKKRATQARGIGPRYVSEVDKYAGASVKRERLARGISQETLAKAIGVTFQQVQKYEKGTNRITIGRLAQVAQALDISLYALLPPDGHAIADTTDPFRILSQTRIGHRAAAAFIALPNDLLRSLYTGLMEATINSVPESSRAG